jgi:linoleoyl-CoA desaturase
MAIEVKATCKRLGIPYNEGSFISQFSQVLWRIFRHALPSKPEGSLDGRKTVQLTS